jgi:hypothetical protein
MMITPDIVYPSSAATLLLLLLFLYDENVKSLGIPRSSRPFDAELVLSDGFFTEPSQVCACCDMSLNRGGLLQRRKLGFGVQQQSSRCVSRVRSAASYSSFRALHD